MKRPGGILRYNIEKMKENGAPEDAINQYLAENDSSIEQIIGFPKPNENELNRMLESERNGSWGKTQKELESRMSDFNERKESREKVMRGLETALGTARSFGQGLFLGFGDEIESGILGKPVEEIRNEQKQFDKEHPVISMGSSIVGGLVNPIGRVTKTPATLGGRVLQGAGIGGSVGALYGLGSGEGGLENRLKNALISGGTGAVIGGAIPAAVEGIKKGTSALLGMTTGTGQKAVQQAYDAGQRGSKKFVDNMRGKVSETQVVDDLQKAVDDMKTKAGQALSSGKQKIGEKAVDFNAISKAIDKIEDELRYKGVDVNSESRLKMINEVRGWLNQFAKNPDAMTVNGADALKQAIGQLSAQRGTPEYALRTRLYNAVKDQISKSAPEYQKLMDAFSDVASVVGDAGKELSLKKGSNVYTTLGKLQSSIRNDAGTRYGARSEALNKLGGKFVQDATDAIAGQSFNTITPRGLTGKLLSGLSGGFGVSSLLTGQGLGALLTLPAFSPRLVGEASYLAGRASNLAPTQNTILKAILAGKE